MPEYFKSFELNSDFFEHMPRSTPLRCSNAVDSTNPIVYKTGLAMADISLPCAWPWNIAAVATNAIAALSGSFLDSKMASPEKTTDNAIPIPT